MRTNLSIIILLIGIELLAHPHTFITNNYLIEIDEHGIDKIKVEWLFDQYFSEAIFNDYDQDKDGDFAESEQKSIYEEAFINTRNYNYFLDISIGDKQMKIDQVDNFEAHRKGDCLVYSFSFFIPDSLNSLSNTSQIITYDPTYYISIDTPKADGLRIINNSSHRYQASLLEKWIDFDLYGELPVNAAVINITSH